MLSCCQQKHSVGEGVGSTEPTNRRSYPIERHPGAFLQSAATNNDFNEEPLHGKQTTHAHPSVLASAVWTKSPLKIYADHASRRSLEQPVQGQLMHKCSVRGKRPAPMSFVGRAEESFLPYWYLISWVVNFVILAREYFAEFYFRDFKRQI